MGGTNFQLKPHSKIPKPQKPLLVVVLDGWGQAADDEYNAISRAETPCMDSLRESRPDKWMLLKAHGTAVGLPSDDDMGNSEVCLGHSPPTLSYREYLFAGSESKAPSLNSTTSIFNQCPRHL